MADPTALDEPVHVVDEDLADVGPGREALERVASVDQPERVEKEDAASALDWLLSDDPEDELPSTKTLELNVGTPQAPKKIMWTIRSIGPEEMKQAQRLALGKNRTSRRAARGQAGDVDQAEANLRIVTMGTIHPDLVEAASRKQQPDPALIVKHRFRQKPGLIDQLAAEILLISGYDDEDIRESPEIRAAGN